MKSKELFEWASYWFCKSKLILNKEKTSPITFSTKKSKRTKLELIETLKIAMSRNAKFLAIYLDENLDWT